MARSLAGSHPPNRADDVPQPNEPPVGGHVDVVAALLTGGSQADRKGPFAVLHMVAPRPNARLAQLPQRKALEPLGLPTDRR